MDINNLPKGTIVVIGTGKSSGILNGIPFEDLKTTIIIKSEDDRKLQHDYYGVPMKSEGLKKIAFAAGRAGCTASEVDSFIKILDDNIRVGVLEAGTAALKAMTYSFVDASLASNQLRLELSKLESASELKPLTEPKCGKFHQNLRSQLNTGGIKWMK